MENIYIENKDCFSMKKRLKYLRLILVQITKSLRLKKCLFCGSCILFFLSLFWRTLLRLSDVADGSHCWCRGSYPCDDFTLSIPLQVVCIKRLSHVNASQLCWVTCFLEFFRYFTDLTKMDFTDVISRISLHFTFCCKMWR